MSAARRVGDCDRHDAEQMGLGSSARCTCPPTTGAVTARASLGKDRAGDSTLVHFQCPGCDDFHSIRVGTWSFNGDLERPTFSPSVLVRYDVSPPNEHLSIVCHSFVTDGRIQFLGDCTHALAGQTVDLPEWKP